MTFRKLRSKRPRPWASKEVVLRRRKRERKLVVRQGTADRRLEHPQTWRRATRKELDQAPSLGSPNAPFLARNQELYVAKNQNLGEAALQIMVILTQWKLVKPQWEDWERLRAYLRSFFRKPERFEQAIERAAEQIVKNWVSPDTPMSFRRYAELTVWRIYSNDLHKTNLEESGRPCGRGSNRRDDIDTEAEIYPGTLPKVTLTRIDRLWFEQAAKPNIKRSAKRSARNDFSPYELALAYGIDHRRIYEAIRNNKLKATKLGKRLRVTLPDAEKWLSQLPRRLHRDAEILDLKKG